MKYGPENPSYAEGAQWLAAFIEKYGASAELVSHVVAVNQARVWEWLRQRNQLPDDIRDRLERWAADGCPRFAYWRAESRPRGSASQD